MAASTRLRDRPAPTSPSERGARRNPPPAGVLIGLMILINLMIVPFAGGSPPSNPGASIDPAAEATSDRPNVVLIVADDLGWADISPNNPDTFYETPNLQRLADRGVRFTQAYAAAPVCSPTRASLMTGRHPARLRTTDYFCGRRAAARVGGGADGTRDGWRERLGRRDLRRVRGSARRFRASRELGGGSERRERAPRQRGAPAEGGGRVGVARRQRRRETSVFSCAFCGRCSIDAFPDF